MLRSHALATALQRRGFEVFVHSLTGRKADYKARRPSSTQRWPEGVEEYVDRSLPSAARWILSYVLGAPPLWLTARLAAGVRAPGEALLPRRLRDRLAWCDVVVADFPFVYPILTASLARDRLRILNTHNIEHRLYDDSRGWRARGMRAAVCAVEIAAAASCDILVSCCEEDAAFFDSHAPDAKSVVVPNGVDVRRFLGTEVDRLSLRHALGLGDGTRVFLFTASRWGPNREAFEYLRGFAREQAALLAEKGIHFLVVGSVTDQPERFPGFTATGRVPRSEPYFAAADAALNPISSGTGTNLKTCEFLAARLPLLTTAFGARGFDVRDGHTGFVFDTSSLAPALARVCALLEEDPGRLRAMAETAYMANERLVDMDVAVSGLADMMDARWTDGARDPRADAG
jgi:glycosyltransferase involved in cell wall biosynthesis